MCKKQMIIKEFKKNLSDGYIVDGKEYRLTLDDCLKLQGFKILN